MDEIDKVAAMTAEAWASAFCEEWATVDAVTRSSVAYSASADMVRAAGVWAERAADVTISKRRRRMLMSQSRAYRSIAGLLSGLAAQADAEIDAQIAGST